MIAIFMETYYVENIFSEPKAFAPREKKES